VQAQILNLLLDLKREGRLAMMFISHDLAVVERIADRIAVMYRGLVMEEASTDTLIAEPLHPYTQALLSAVPTIRPGLKRERIRLHGEQPKATEELVGCPFASRCPIVEDICRKVTPPLEAKEPGHSVACHRVKSQVG